MSDFISYTNFGNILRVQPNFGLETLRVSPTFGIKKGGGSSELVEELLGLPGTLPDGYIIPDDTEIYNDLQDIITTMDINFTIEMAEETRIQTEAIVENDVTIGEKYQLGGESALEQFYGVVAPQGCEWMTEQDVYQWLEHVMQIIDINLTPEKAKEITQQTLNN